MTTGTFVEHVVLIERLFLVATGLCERAAGRYRSAPIGPLSACARAELGIAPSFGLEGRLADDADVPRLTLPAFALFAASGAGRLAPMFVELHALPATDTGGVFGWRSPAPAQ